MNVSGAGKINDLSLRIEEIEREEMKEAHFIYSNEIVRRLISEGIQRVSQTFIKTFELMLKEEALPPLGLVEETLQGQAEQALRECVVSIRDLLDRGITEGDGQNAPLIPGIDPQDIVKGMPVPLSPYTGELRSFKKPCEHCTEEVKRAHESSLKTLRGISSRTHELSLAQLKHYSEKLHEDYTASNLQLLQNTVHQARLLHQHCIERKPIHIEIWNYRAEKGKDLFDACMKEDEAFIRKAVEEAGFFGRKSLFRSTFEDKLSFDFGRTPLTYAASHNKLKSVKALVEGGADVTYPDNTGDTPLHRAAKIGSAGMFDLFCAKGASVTALGECNRSPLHYAAYNGHAVFVLALLNRGADPNVQTNEEDGCKTPLHDAVNQGQEEVVAALLAMHANPHLVDKKGFTPLHNAIHKGLDVILKLLLEHSGWRFSNDPKSPCHISSLLNIKPPANQQEIFKLLIGHAPGLYLTRKVKEDESFRQQLFDTISSTRLVDPCRALAWGILRILQDSEIWAQNDLFIAGLHIPKLRRFAEEEGDSLRRSVLTDIDEKNAPLLAFLGIDSELKKELLRDVLRILVTVNPLQKQDGIKKLLEDKNKRNQLFEWLEKCRQGIFSVQVAREALSLLGLAKVPLNKFNFDGTNIEGANLQQAQLFGAKFNNTNTRGVNFSGAVLSHAQMGANMDQAVFGQLVYPLSTGIKALVSSSKGDYFFAGCEDGSIRVWNVKRGSEVSQIFLNNKGVSSLLLINDHTLAVGGNDRSLKVFDLKQGRLLYERQNLNGRATHLGYLKKENRLLSAGEDKTVYLWSLDQSFAPLKLEGPPVAVCNVAVVSTEAHSLVFAEAANQILYKWDVSTQKSETIRPAWLAQGMRSLTAIPGKTKVAWTINNRSVVVFDFLTRATEMLKINEDLDEEAPVLCIGFSHDGKWLAATTKQGISLIDWQRKAPVHLLPQLSSKVESLQFLSGNKLLVNCSDKTVRVLDLPLTQEYRSLPKPVHMGWHQASSTLIAKFPDSSPEAWHRDSGAPQDLAHFKQTDSILQNFSGDLFALRVEGMDLCVYNHQGVKLTSFPGTNFRPETAIFLGEGRFAIQLGSYHVSIYNLTTRAREELWRTDESDGTIELIRAVAPGQLAIVCSHSDWRIWNYFEETPPQKQTTIPDPIKVLLFHRDQMISSGIYGSIEIRPVKGGQPLSLTGHKDNVTSLAVLEGSLLISCSLDKTVRFWDMQTGQELLSLPHPVPLSTLKLRGNEGLYVADVEGGIWYWKLRRQEKLDPELVWANQPEFIATGVDTQKMQNLSPENKAFLVEHGATP